MPRTLGTPRHYVLRDFIVEKREKAGLTQHEVSARLKRPSRLLPASKQASGGSMSLSYSTWPRLSGSIHTRPYGGFNNLLKSN